MFLYFILFFLGFCFESWGASPDTVSVLVPEGARFELSGFYMAQEKGYYAQAQLQLRLVTEPSRWQRLALLEAGMADFAIVDPGVLGIFIQDRAISSLLPLYQHSPYVLVMRHSSARTFAQAESSLAYGNDPWVQAEGGRSSQAVQEFLSGKRDVFAAHAGRGTYGLMAQGTPFVIHRPQYDGEALYGDCLVALKGKEPKAKEALFLAATRKGFAEALWDIQAAAALVRRHLPQPVSLDELLYEGEVFRYLNSEGDNLRFGRWARIDGQGGNRLFRGVGAQYMGGTPSQRQMYPPGNLRASYKLWMWASVGVVGVILLLVVFNMRLRRAVRAQTARLQASQNRLELALHSASDGVWERPDHRSDELWISSRIYEMLGIVASGYEPTFTGFCSFVQADDVISLRLAQSHAVASASHFQVEMRINTVRGWRWFRLRGAGQDNGRGGRRVSGVLQDIHDARLALEALKKNEARLRQYFEVGLVGVAMLDPDGLVQNVNSILAGWLGYDDKQCQGRHWKEFTFTEDIPLEEMLFAELREGKRESYKLDKRLLRASDASVWHALVAVRAIEGGTSLGRGFVMTVLDITERQAGEAERERLARMLSLKNRTLESTLFAISHDFSRPLERMGEQVARLREGAESIRPEYAAIEGELGLMERMSKALLKLSRLGGTPAESRLLDVTALVNSVAQEMAPRVHGAGAELCVFALPPCKGDEIQLYQVFAQLLDNALRFRDMQRGCSIVVSGEENAEHVCYRVRDNGCGIAPRDLGQVLTPFFATESCVDHVKGLGVGLAFVARIVETHGGSVQVYSEPGQWTEVCFTLPKT